MIVGIAEGTTTITVTSGDGKVSRTINLTVKKKLLGLNVYRYSSTLYVGETYEFWCSLNPSDYETTSSVEWTTDSDRISISKLTDRSANITILKPGDWDLKVTLDDVSKTINYYAFISDDSYGYEVASDNTVELWWDPVEDATGYWLYDKSGNYLAFISPDETTEKYTYTDETYKNDYTQSSAVYQLRYNIDGEIYAVNIDVTLNTIATITYEVGDGTQNENNPTTYSPGTEVTLYDPTPPEGYEFDGWYLSSNYSSTSKREKILETDSGNLTLYAKYVKITYTVTFVKNNGSSDINATVEYGDAVSKPSNIFWYKHTLEGWYLDEECTNEYDFTTKVYESFSLYAKWNVTIDGISILQVIDDSTESEFIVNELESGDSITLKARVYPENSASEIAWVNYGDEDVPVYADIFPSDAATVTLNTDKSLTITANKLGTVTVGAYAVDNEEISYYKTISLKEVLPQRVLLDVISESDISDTDTYGIYMSGADTLKGSITLTGKLYNTQNPDNTTEYSANQEVNFTSSNENYVVIDSTGIDENGLYYAVIKPAENIVFPSDKSYVTARITAVSTANNAARAEYDVVVRTSDSDEDIILPELQIISSGKNPVIYASSKADTTADLNEDGINLAVGKNTTVKAQFIDVEDEGSVLWSSANSAVATITSSGKITAKSAGDVVISATSGDRELTASIRVKVYDPVTKLTLDSKSVKLGIGQSITIAADTILPTTASNELKFESSNENVATVDESTGLVKGISAGKTVITATTAAGEKKAKCTVTVGNAVSSITIKSKSDKTTADSYSYEIAAGKKLQLQTIFNNGEKTYQPANKEVTWEITGYSSEDVASISSKGVITASKEGWISVIARSTTDISGDDYVSSNPVYVYVYVPIKKASLSKTSVSVYPGSSYTMSATLVSTVSGEEVTGSGINTDGNPEGMSDEIVWTYKKDSDAENDYLGIGEGVTGETCTVTVDSSCTANQKIPVIATFTPHGSKAKTLTCNVTVSDGKVKKLNLSTKKLSINQGGDGIITAKLNPDVPVDPGVTWVIDDDSRDLVCFIDDSGNSIMDSSSTTSYATTYCQADVEESYSVRVRALSGATVKSKAYITAITNGTNSKGYCLAAKVTVEIGGGTETIIINSGKKDVTWNSSSSDNTDKLIMLAEGRSTTLKAVAYSDYSSKTKAGNQKVTWTSSDESIATVNSSGKVTAVGSGNVEITACSTDKNYENSKADNIQATALIYAYASATNISLDKTKASLATAISDNTVSSSLRQYEVVTPIITPDDIFDNAQITSGATDASALADYNVITWNVDCGEKGCEFIAVKAINTEQISNATDSYTKQNIISLYDSEFTPISPESESFDTEEGESLAIKALRPGKIKLTATAPGGKKATCVLTVYTHVDDLSLKLSWEDGEGGSLGSYSGDITKTVTINKEKKNVTVLAKTESTTTTADDTYDYAAYLDLKNIKSIKLTTALDISNGVCKSGDGYVEDRVPYSDKKTDSVTKQATALYNAAKKYVINSAVNYSSSDTSVVIVDSKGKLTAKGTGNAVITISTSDGSITKTILVDVAENVEERISDD